MKFAEGEIRTVSRTHFYFSDCVDWDVCGLFCFFFFKRNQRLCSSTKAVKHKVESLLCKENFLAVGETTRRVYKS